MSIASKTYTANGSTTIFQSDFAVLSENHIEVIVNGNEVSKSDYDLINDSAVFAIAPTVGSTVVLRVGTTPDDLLTSTTNIDTVAGNIGDINTVEDNMSDINTVADDISNINTVAGKISNIDIVAGIGTDGLNGIVTNVDNIATVGGIYEEITNVSNIASDVQIVANSIDSVNNFGDTYFVGDTAPTSPTEGDLWFDTVANELKVYKGSTFAALSGGQYYGDGAVKGIEYFAQSSVASDDIVIESTNNALSVESFTIEDGASVTVESGATWKVL